MGVKVSFSLERKETPTQARKEEEEDETGFSKVGTSWKQEDKDKEII